MKKKKILLSDHDRALLAGLVMSDVKGAVLPYLEFVRDLKDELKQACILPLGKMPDDVVMINSTVWITDLDSGTKESFTLVMPDEADGTGRISILSPIGMALLGYRIGDELAWGPVAQLLRLRIDNVRQIRSCLEPA